MSWVKKLKKKVAKAINKAAKKVADAIKKAGQDIRERSKGHGAFVRWCGRVAEGLCDAAAAGTMGLAATVTAVTDSTIGGIGGLVTGHWNLAWQSLVDSLADLAGGALVTFGSLVSLIQTAIGVEHHKRLLTDHERETLQLVFRESLDVDIIRIISGRSGVYGLISDRPFTLDDTIYMKDTAADDWDDTLVHEATHLWQYQHMGCRYTADALGAQLFLWKDAAGDWQAYHWWMYIHRPWSELNREAQAEILQDVYLCGLGPDEKGNLIQCKGCFFRPYPPPPNQFLWKGDHCPKAGEVNLDDITKYANAAVAFIRIRDRDQVDDF
jgi:hypothetical protein